MEIQESTTDKNSLYYFYKLLNKNVIRSYYKFSETFDRLSVIRERFPPSYDKIEDSWEFYWRLKSMSYKEMVSKFENIIIFVILRLVNIDSDQAITNYAYAPLSKIYKWSFKRILKRNSKKFQSDGDLDLIIDAGQSVISNLIHKNLFSNAVKHLGVLKFLLFFLKQSDCEESGLDENYFRNDLNEFNLISLLRLFLNNINELLLVRDLRNIVIIKTFAKQFEFLTKLIKQFRILPVPTESSVFLIKDILVFAIRNMCPNDFFLQPTLLGKDTIIPDFFKELSMFIVVNHLYIYKSIDFETCDIVSCLCSLLLFFLKNKAVNSSIANFIDFDDNINAIMKCAKKRLEEEYPSSWPLNNSITEQAFQAVKINFADVAQLKENEFLMGCIFCGFMKWRRIFKFLYLGGKSLTSYMNEKNYYFWMSSIDLIKKHNSTVPEIFSLKTTVTPLNNLIILAFKNDISFKDLNKIIELILSTECPKALLLEFYKLHLMRHPLDLADEGFPTQLKYIKEVYNERLRHPSNSPLAKFLIHFTFSLSDEYINDLPKTASLFADLVGALQNNFSLLIQTISFEARRLHKLLKTPDLYGGLIDGIGRSFVKLFENIEEYSKTVMNKNLGREVEVATFSEAILLFQKLLQIPSIFPDQKHHKLCRRQRQKKTHFVFVQFPFFCLNCGKYLKAFIHSFPNQEKHLFVICRVCEHVIEPYCFKSSDSNIAIIKTLKEKAKTWENEIRRALSAAIEKKKERLLKLRSEKPTLNSFSQIENYFTNQDYTFLACLENVLRIYQ